jgi:hypothetical protein
MISAKHFSEEPQKITVDGDEYMVDSQTRLNINQVESGLFLTLNGTRTYNGQGMPNDADAD